MGLKLDLIINGNYSKLNDVNLHILHLVQANLKLCTTISTADLVGKCNAPTATVLRVTQKLDFSGCSEFKSFLKNDTEKANVSMLDTIEIISQDILQTIKLFKQNKEINEICWIIGGSDNIYTYGTGHEQRLMPREFARCFLNVNKNIILILSLTELKIIKKFTKKTDLLFIASWPGNIDKHRDTLINLEALGIPIISITCLDNNDLSAMSKYGLYSQSSTMGKDTSVNRSPHPTLHLVLHLLYDDYIDHAICETWDGADIDKNYTKPIFYNTTTLLP